MSAIPLKSMLDEAGLNRQHVFDLRRLPAELLMPLSMRGHERQLILFAHAGRRLWDRVRAKGMRGADPIDEYSVRTVSNWCARALPRARHRFVYPCGLPEGRHLGLQRLGELAGWHHPTPLRIGIDTRWGSWFAYRAAILTDTDLPATPAQDHGHPCRSCTVRTCITACPAHALDSGELDSRACQRQRLAEGSPCALACPSREACPVGAEHRYDESQVRHGAAVSLAAIRRLAAGGG